MELKQALEALIFAAGRPLSLSEIQTVAQELLGEEAPSRDLIETALSELQQEWETRSGALELVSVAHGYEFRTKPDYGPWILTLNKEKPHRLSASALETLAIIAYRQPMTRADIENIRGVDAGPVVRSLLERKLIRMVGRKEEPGRPMLYATSKEFLEIFSLNDLSELPPLSEFEDRVKAQMLEERLADTRNNTDVELSDLLSSTDEILSLEEGGLLSDLENELKSLKDVEKNVLESFASQSPTPSEAAENPEPETSH